MKTALKITLAYLLLIIMLAILVYVFPDLSLPDFSGGGKSS
jgi:hypothetical protein